MDASYAAATLWISTDDTVANLEVVATLTVNDTNTSRVEAVRGGSSSIKNGPHAPIFPDPTRGNRYLMDFVANRTLSGSNTDDSDSSREISRMQLVWNGKSNYRKVWSGSLPSYLANLDVRSGTSNNENIYLIIFWDFYKFHMLHPY